MVADTEIEIVPASTTAVTPLGGPSNRKPIQANTVLPPDDFISERILRTWERDVDRYSREWPKRHIGPGVCVNLGLEVAKGHSGYFGCDKCTQEGVSVACRLTFPYFHSPMRTHEAFLRQNNAAHHIEDLPSCDIPTDMISTFLINCMHLVRLGVMKRMLNLWLFGPVDRNLRLGMNNTLISDCISDLQHAIPCDFA
ncbi:hypothetical protein PHET_09853 [Paragonimus heterotremus]|uniref:Uncharacterized protein n=1 Tax=Paragonimus heterotremus TaxID=100268 RepID=A0A8J4WNI1_9TREM|nr:hypothetical protein PHET_09853 [Paragonimus heterotremus]